MTAGALPSAAIAMGLNLGQPKFSALPPLSLYVHVPWCLKKCPYCDFNSHATKAGTEVPEVAYVDALLADLEAALPLIWGRKVGTIFFGGGTPSLFSATAIDRFLAGVRARVPLLPEAEVTLEANPGTFEAAKFAEYRAAGINRLSIGIQSFDGRFLERLGRVHDAREAHRAVEIGLATIGNINLDLMFALPGQTPDECAADLAAALAYQPPHLSYYHLTLEPNTLFHRYPPELPDDDAACEMQDRIERATAAAGYEHYETSAYARPGRQCRHNLNYWQFGDYLGIGAGAHSKLSFPDKVIRQMRYKQPAEYLRQVASGNAVHEEQLVTRRDIGFEFMLNALRLEAGVPTPSFEERTGYPLALVAPALEQATKRGLLVDDPAMIRATPLGRRFLNDLTALFLPD